MGWSQPYKEHFLSLNLMVENYPGTEIWDPDVPWHLNPRVLSVAHMVSEGRGCTGKARQALPFCSSPGNSPRSHLERLKPYTELGRWRSWQRICIWSLDPMVVYVCNPGSGEVGHEDS